MKGAKGEDRGVKAKKENARKKEEEAICQQKERKLGLKRRVCSEVDDV